MVEKATTAFEERLSELTRQARDKSSEVKRPILVSISEEWDSTDPLRLFTSTAQFASERWYWERPTDEFAIAGAGVASGTMSPWKVRFEEADRVRQQLIDDAITDGYSKEDGPLPLFFAGFSFDPERKPDRRVWKGFPPVYLYVPRVMLTRQRERFRLTFNLQVTPAREPETIRDLTERLRQRVLEGFASESRAGNPKVVAEMDEENERVASNYQEIVATATDEVRSGRFEKVVLARYQDIRTGNYFDISAAIERMRAEYPGCYTFAVARHGSVFLGSSPEQLVKLDGKEVSTACLAGSIRRGGTREEDEALGQQLLSSAKDQHEHEVCVRAIREALEPLCDDLNVPDSPELMTVSNVHHLYTPVRGHLNNGATLIRLVERLHPTPAVGGYPKDDALKFLRENEGFDRGWYASPLGWIDTEGDGEFAVTLRSAVISGQRARLFAGCGIVGESDPQQELAESNVKLRPMLSALRG